MPPHINGPATVGIVAATVVVAAAIAIYESPEVRAFAVQTRRRLAEALHSLGDDIHPAGSRNANAQPRFNRPEDAEGFYQSGGDVELDGDEESRRRQREELMYWNQIRLENEAKKAAEQRKNGTRGASFDDFLHEDTTAEKGTYVYNSGTDVNHDRDMVQRRATGIRELGAAGAFEAGSSLANPFADENHIEMEHIEMEHIVQQVDSERMAMSEVSEGTDIYGVEDDLPQPCEYTRITQAESGHLVDISESFHPEVSAIQDAAPSSWNDVTSGTEAHPDAYQAIHAWANASQNPSSQEHNDFYSPLPVTPQNAMSDTSDLEHVDGGDFTPTDSVSLAGTGEDVAMESAEEFDNMSDSEGAGISTPGSWTEVGSVVSEDEQFGRA